LDYPVRVSGKGEVSWINTIYYVIRFYAVWPDRLASVHSQDDPLIEAAGIGRAAGTRISRNRAPAENRIDEAQRESPRAAPYRAAGASQGIPIWSSGRGRRLGRQFRSRPARLFRPVRSLACAMPGFQAGGRARESGPGFRRLRAGSSGCTFQARTACE
jgi:hypothetical protein